MLAVHRNLAIRISRNRGSALQSCLSDLSCMFSSFFHGFRPRQFSGLNSLNQFLLVVYPLIHPTVTRVPSLVLTPFRVAMRGSLFLDMAFGGMNSGSACYFYSTKPPTRSLRRRISKKKKERSKPVFDESQFKLAVSQLPPRFTPEELYSVIVLQENPVVCFELFNWASQQHRFKHDTCSYHITIKKLGLAKMYEEMDHIVNQVLAVSHLGNEALYNSIIYYFTEARKLTRAVNIFKRMRSSKNLECRPSIRTYHILLKALLGRRSNSYINYMYMETIRCLFKQMVDDGIEPDAFALNCMIKGYVISLHVNDALRIFHQMGVVYDCRPDAYTYDYLIHGLCAQGRTINAKELFEDMKLKGFAPSCKSYNSLVSALAIGREIQNAVTYFWEMIDKQKSVDLITYRTIIDEMSRQGEAGEAVRFLRTLKEKRLVDEDAYKKLVQIL